MDTYTLGKSPAACGTLARHISRAREADLNKFNVTPEDLASMEQIARVSSRGPALGAADFDGQPTRWTELAIYHRAGWTRPFVAVVEGKSSVPGEKQRFQYAAMGTLERAANWFEGSRLRDELLQAIPEDWAAAPHQSRDIPVYATSLAPPLPLSQDEDGNLTLARPAPAAPLGFDVGGYRGEPTLTGALRWLYGGDFGSDRALAIEFERDFGVPERSTRNTLAIEAGRAEGKVGPWLQPFLHALRYFDKRRWRAGREKADG